MKDIDNVIQELKYKNISFTIKDNARILGVEVVIEINKSLFKLT